jgi:hypothetical protein
MTASPLPPEAAPVDNAGLHGTGEAGPVRESREARVRRLLVAPLEEEGMRRPRSRSAEAHQDWIARIARRVAYLSDAHLALLREVVGRNGQGKDRAEWPAELSILAWAHALEPPPDEDSRLVSSYLASAAGLRAWGEGPAVAVALRSFLRKWGRPPADGDWSGIRKDAGVWLAEMARIDEFLRHGTASAAQRERRAVWDSTVERVRRAVFASAEGGA